LNRKGFTLVEILLATALLVVIISAFSFGLKQAISAANSNHDFSRALYAARSQMEEMRRIPFEGLPTLNGTSFSAGSGKIYVATLLPDLLSLQIDLKWNPKRPSLRIYTLRSRHR